MKLFCHLLLLILSITCLQFTQAQTAPFQNEINEFKKKDSAHFPPKSAILFVGSSSFRMWSDVQSYFPGYPIINRGFGGSTLEDVIHFAPDIIFPYQPKQVVVYGGDNDLAADTSVTALMVFDRFRTLYQMIRHELGDEVSVVFVAIKPSPSRKQLLPKMIAANQLVKQFVSTEKHAAFADVFHPMLDVGGNMRPELYKEDMLHMKPEGYAIWKKVIEAYLAK